MVNIHYVRRRQIGPNDVKRIILSLFNDDKCIKEHSVGKAQELLSTMSCHSFLQTVRSFANTLMELVSHLLIARAAIDQSINTILAIGASLQMNTANYRHSFV